MKPWAAATVVRQRGGYCEPPDQTAGLKMRDCARGVEKNWMCDWSVWYIKYEIIIIIIIIRNEYDYGGVMSEDC